MGAISFHTAHPAAGRPRAVLAAARKTIDRFVSCQMQHAAAEAEYPRREHAHTPPRDEPAGDNTQFQPLDSGIVSEAIPGFFIGCNSEGFWVARDAKGRIGGLFLFKSSALSFARNNSRPTGCATIFPSHRFELDLENHGNALVPHLGSMKRLVTRHLQRLVASIGR
jgi:hypothetical protein